MLTYFTQIPDNPNTMISQYSPKTITWLHLSDRHTYKEKTGLNAPRVLDPLIIDLKKMESDHGLIPQLIFFTGDAAFGNTPVSKIEDQFKDFDAFINSIRKAFSVPVPKKNVFLVPGNHDVDRNQITPANTEWLRNDRSPDDIYSLIDGGGLDWAEYARRLYPYREFLITNGYRHLVDDKGRFTYAAKRKFHDIVVGIGGMNSAWSCSEKFEKGKLWLGGKWQTDKISIKLKNANIRIGLLHHPIGWFVQQESPFLQSLFEQDFHFLLHGHEHQDWVSANVSVGVDDAIRVDHVRVAASACYERSDAINGYNFVRLNVDTGNGEIWLRRFTNNAWGPSIVRNRTDDKGLWRLKNLSCLNMVRTMNFAQPPLTHPFVGREKELHKITKLLQKSGCIYIWGSTGIGKTALGSEAAWRLRDHFKGRIIYLKSSSQCTEDILNSIARAFSENGLIDLPLPDKLNKIELLLQQHQPTLVYLDDLRSSNVLEDIRRFFSSSTFLVTSRNAPKQFPLEVHRLFTMDRNASIKLFVKICCDGESLPQRDIKAIDDICRSVGDLPIVVAMLAYQSKISSLSIPSLLHILKENLLDIVLPWTASMNLIYEDLVETTRHCFSLLSLFRGNTFSADAALALSDNNLKSISFYELIERSLVKPVDLDRYVLHGLIHKFAESKLAKFGDYTIFLKRINEYFLEYSEKNRANFDNLQVELENILTTMEDCYRNNDTDNLLRFTYALVERYPGEYAYGFLAARGYWNEAVDIIHRCLESEIDLTSQSKLYEHLGFFYYLKSENDKARKYYQFSNDRCQKLGNFTQKAILFHRLGFIESDEGNYNRAEQLYRKSVEIALKNNLSIEHLATGIHLVGVILYHQCRYEDSQKKLQLALEMRKNSPGASSVTKRRLAGTYRRLGLIDGAQALIEESLKFERTRGNERNVARCLRQKGMILHIKGKDNDSIDCFLESHNIFQKVGNKKGIACTLTNLGEISLAQGDIEVAKSYLEKSLEMAKEQRSEYGIAINLRWLAEVAFKREMYVTAAKLSAESLDHFEFIGHIHVQELCQRLNESLLKIDQDLTPTVNFPNTYLGNKSREIQNVFADLWIKSKPFLMMDDPIIDSNLNNLDIDKRRGISLIFRPSKELTNMLTKICDRLRKISPDQHYYKPTEFHITLMTLITASEEMGKNAFNEELCIRGLRVALAPHRPFRLQFKGIGATRDSIVAHGFFRDGSLDVIRNDIRQIAPKLGIGWKQDPYPRISAHITLVRFKEATKIKDLASEIDKLNGIELGVCPVSEIELVFNNWYMTDSEVQVLERFRLK